MSEAPFPPPPGGSPASDPWGFAKLMPGLEFMQQWARSAGAALPGVGQWVAPTLDPEELGKRIDDLRTVQFWLEQNARMIAMTIQALEVQRMTLDTLRGMNVPVDALRETLSQTRGEAPRGPFDSPFGRPTAAAASAASAASAAPVARPGGAAGEDGDDDGRGTSDDGASDPAAARADTAASSGADTAGASAAAAAAAASDAAAAAGATAVDAMRWWGSLTQQFAQIAGQAVQDALKDGPPLPGGGHGPAPSPRPAAGSGTAPVGATAPRTQPATPRGPQGSRRVAARAPRQTSAHEGSDAASAPQAAPSKRSSSPSKGGKKAGRSGR